MLKPFLHRVRRFFTAEVLAEVSALRGESAALRIELATLRNELAAQVKPMEAALLTIALAREEREGGG